MTSITYRPDVDGLRAVAVVLVLLFHASIGFSGGFVGVDVFFVISGFLITGIIRRKLDEKAFSFSGFYLRRIRRILPAASACVLLTLVAGWFLLLPSDYEDLGRSAIAQQFLSANVYFWLNTGYFDGPADFKPLLHHWSLGIEEQFYLIYPFFLVWLSRFSKRRQGWIIATCAGVSLALCEWTIQTTENAGFFLLHGRAWEFLVGGLLWYLPARNGPQRISSELISIGGLMLITISAVFLTKEARFPGLMAIPTCLGSCLVIYGNSTRSTLVHRWLSCRVLVGIGLISYSLYLWHWPLFAFARYQAESHLTLPLRVALLIASFILAYLSWRFIEQPLRRPRPNASRFQPLKASVISVLGTVGLSSMIVLTNGATQRFSEELLVFDQRGLGKINPQYDGKTKDAMEGQLPMIGEPLAADGSPDFLVWGDSHARSLAVLLDELARENGLSGALATKGGAGPFLSLPEDSSDRNQWNAAVIQIIESKKIPHVLLIGRWSNYFKNDENQSGLKKRFRTGFRHTIDALETLPTKIWLIEQVPEQPNDPNLKLWKAAWASDPTPTGVTLREHRDHQAAASEFIHSLVDQDTILLDPTDWCVDSTGYTKIGDSGGSFYFDDDHLSVYGAKKLLRSFFEPVFREFAERTSSNKHQGSQES